MSTYETKLTRYKKFIDSKIKKAVTINLSSGLYEPLSYVLSGGGKRIRPLLLMMFAKASGGNIRDTVNAAIAIELLHTFTLIHDDIMDNADTRRGKATIHKMWDEGTAILAGDGLSALAYRYILKTKSPNLFPIIKAFTEALIKVCKGQSLDKEYETRTHISINEYLTMIRLKTSELLIASAIIGVYIANGSSQLLKAARGYAFNLGLAFQVQDDLLDVVGDVDKFGKKIGGDLWQGKKTFLLILALELVKKREEKALLKKVVLNKGIQNKQELEDVIDIYQNIGVISEAEKLIQQKINFAKRYLTIFPDSEAKEMLKWFSNMLMKRES
ncbi:MAG: polyprenyl synthetase family protein [Ignavibacteria bacterium]